jgi:hypothetical protein
MSISRSVLYGDCASIEPILKLFLYKDNWLNSFVAVERAVIILKGTSFDKTNSKFIARWTIVILPFLIISSIIHEPLHRALLNDNEEKRIWCVTCLSRPVEIYNRIILFFHFPVPFCASLVSTLLIIFMVARRRSVTRPGQSYQQHLREQLSEHNSF